MKRWILFSALLCGALLCASPLARRGGTAGAGVRGDRRDREQAGDPFIGR